MIPRQTVEKILDETKIEEVVGDFVTLKRRGANLIACCPFHNEKTPSFYVSPSKGIFKCFGCGKSGTAVKFIEEHEHLTYPEALRYLARKYHIEVVEKEETAEEINARNRKESLMLVNEFARKYFTECLHTPDGQIGYAYFRSRGVSDATMEKFGLGWAPEGRDNLLSAARSAGFKEEYLVDTGLCFRTEDNKVFDRFHGRVAFPIHDVNGRVIAFGCRTLKNDKTVAKYINSPETEIYLKRTTLYGMSFAKNEVHRQDKFILVEGYLDVITMHQLGITNVAASSGTSLTVEQVKLIKRFTDNVTIIYDGDPAGIHAALRGIGLVLEGGLNVKVVLLPDGDDPDSFGRAHTKEEVLAYIAENEQDFIGFKTKMLLDDAGRDPIKRAGLINDIADTIALIPDPVKRSVYVTFASQELDIDEQLLFSRIKQTRTRMLEQKRREMEREAEKGAGRSGDGRYGNRGNGVPGAGSMEPDGGWEGLVPPARDDQDDMAMALPEDESYAASEGNGAENEPLPFRQAPRSPRRDAVTSCERELLGFVLKNGRSQLVFDQDSPYYGDGTPLTVAEFIDSVMYQDNAEFAEQAYRQCYEKYFELYALGLSQEQISVRLLSDENPEICNVARDLIEEKHLITVKKFEASLTNEATALAQFVPKSIMAYQKARVEKEIKTLTRNMKTATEEEAEEMMKRIMELNKIKKGLINRLGRA